MRSAFLLLASSLLACGSKKSEPAPAPSPAPDAAPVAVPVPVDRCALLTAVDLADVCGFQGDPQPYRDETKGCARKVGRLDTYYPFGFYTSLDAPRAELGKVDHDHRAMESEMINLTVQQGTTYLTLHQFHSDGERPPCTDDQLQELAKRALSRLQP